MSRLLWFVLGSVATLATGVIITHFGGEENASDYEDLEEQSNDPALETVPEKEPLDPPDTTIAEESKLSPAEQTALQSKSQIQ